jgi:hypothetical protein
MFGRNTTVRDQTESPVLRCASLFVDKVRRKTGSSAELKPQVEGLRAVKVSLGGVRSEGSETTSYIARTPTDPRLEISILTGQSLLEHLRAIGDGYLGDDAKAQFAHDLMEDSWQYFLQPPSQLATEPVFQVLEANEFLEIDVTVARSEGLRTGYAVRFHDLDTNVDTTTQPTFLTSVGSAVVSTDLPPGLLSPEQVSLLSALDEAAGELSALATSANESVDVTWDRIVQATEELGASNVGDALLVLGLTAALRERPTIRRPRRKAPARRAVAKKAPARRAVAKKAPVKRAVAKKAPARRAVAKKAVAKKAPVKRAVAKKAPARRAVVKKAPVKRAVAKKAPARRAVAKKAPARRAVAKKAPARRAVAKKAPVKRGVAKAPAKSRRSGRALGGR